MLMKISFLGLTAILVCSAFYPVMAQTSAPSDMAPPPAAVAPTTPEEPLQKPTVKKPSFYDEHGNPFTSKYRETTAAGVLLALQRDPALPHGHFVLFMSAGKPVISCARIKNPKSSTRFEGETMIVEIEKYIIDERDMPRYAHYECNKTPQEPVAVIHLSKDQMQEHNVKKVKFKIDKKSETYRVKMTENYIQFIPESRRDPTSEANRFRPMRVDGVANPLKFWFYPEGTVILSAQGASKDITIESKLMELASSKGLTPMTDLVPEHEHFRKKPDSYYFIDKQGRYKVSNGDLFDYIQTDAMKFGLEADEPVKKNLAVFIRKPGQYE